jgi:hypothetical protein
MSTSFCLGYVSFSTTVGQFRQPSMSNDCVAAASETGVESRVRSQRLPELALLQLDELEPAVGEPHSPLTAKSEEWSIWGCDMLPGVMAGKRPPKSPIG